MCQPGELGQAGRQTAVLPHHAGQGGGVEPGNKVIVNFSRGLVNIPGEQQLTSKFDFPDNLCNAAFAILAMFKLGPIEQPTKKRVILEQACF